jgi:hypothetical protein
MRTALGVVGHVLWYVGYQTGALGTMPADPRS